MNDLEWLREAIQRLHGCGSTHVKSVSVMELFQKRTVWLGTVELFELSNHPQARRCYAWSHSQAGAEAAEAVVVLELPPIDSPLAAVRAARLLATKQNRGSGLVKVCSGPLPAPLGPAAKVA